MFLKIIRLFCLLSFVYLSGHAWFRVRDGFSVRRIVYLPEQKSHPDGEREAKISPFFDQPYYYMARGRQCYVFRSADDQVIIKIPRFDRYRLSNYLKAFSLPFKKLSLLDRTKRLTSLLESFRIAEEDFSDYTGVLYSHLNQTTTLPKKFVLYDRLHRSFSIDLNKTVFAIQKKHPLFVPLFLKELKEGNREKAHEMLNSLLHVMKERGERRLFNKDAHFLKNYSWDGEKCIQIDIGSFYRDPAVPVSEVSPRSFYQGAWPLREWLSGLDAQFASQVEEDLRECWSIPK